MPIQPTDRTFAAVIFDMDGTLIDSTPAVLRAWTQWAIDEGVPAEALSGYHGVPSASVVAAVLPPERRAEALTRINRLELTDTEGIVPLPGAIDAFDRLPADRVAIATSCTGPLADARLTASGLTRPKVLVTVDDVDRGKPAPDPYLVAAQRLGFDASDCLVVEDAPKGIQSARAAGASSLAVVTTSPRNDLADADLVVPNLAAVDWIVDGESGEIRLSLR
jgi:sugar-phosphatase